ncbi:MAG: nucleoside kinase [Eubacteriaceae bacterium]|nr:nucleoside kinase [Eubacteriaceae bacterium]
MKETHLRQHRQTSKLGLIKVVRDLFPEETLKTAYSIQEGVFCRLAGSILSEREVKQIEIKLTEWVNSDSPIEFLYKKDGYYQYLLGDLVVKTIYPADVRTSMVEPFKIIPYSAGFIIDFGDISVGNEKKLIPPDKLSENYDKTQLWLDNIDMELISDVNNYIAWGKSLDLINIAEALQEKEISMIADMIMRQRRALQVLLISGPSSSGKTSFAQRLSTQLKVNGLKPVPLSLDDYFVNRVMTPRDEEGNYDFENLDSLDLDLFQEQITQLINGESVETPIFDFITGTRMKRTRTMQIGPSEILVIEGIHALDPMLLPHINRSLFFKIYISALFELNVDLMNRIPTTEVRLMRRLVRGDQFRGTHPEETLDQWPNVRKGEYNNIFKYQEEADVMFNSSLLYEMNALRPFAEASLNKISDNSRHADTKERLLNLLSFVTPIDISKVPFNSILREFIGGSIYFPNKE